MSPTEKSNPFEKRIKKHLIGKPHRFMAVAPLGFEQTLINELNAIGIDFIGNLQDEDIEKTKISHTGIAISGDGKVEFTAKITEAWKVIAHSRIANRVLIEIANFKAENFGQLEKKTSEIPWELFLPADAALEFHTSCKHSRLYHSDAVEERVRKAIANHVKAEKLQNRSPSPDKNAPQNCTPSPDKNAPQNCTPTPDKNAPQNCTPTPDKNAPQNCTPSPDKNAPQNCTPTPDKNAPQKNFTQHIYIQLEDDRCTLWLDFAGEELYKRGQGRFVAEAPLKETLAAAMIFEATALAENLAVSPFAGKEVGPQPENDSFSANGNRATRLFFVDPMAGSGTFSLEIAYAANGLIPGKCRDFALKHQPAFKEGTWNFILKNSSIENNPNEKRSRHKGGNILGKAFNNKHLKIITSDILDRSVDIIRHNVQCSPLSEIGKENPEAAIPAPKLRDFFQYSPEDFCETFSCGNIPCTKDALGSTPKFKTKSAVIFLLNPPYGKRLAFDAPKLYTRIGRKLSELSREFRIRHQDFVVAILSPKDCTSNLLKECPLLSPKNNKNAKLIETSHGGFSLNAFFAKI